MLEIAMRITIETLWKSGKSKNEISRLTGHDWKTVNKIIKSIKQTGSYPCKKPHPKFLDNHKTQILEFIEQDLTGVRIFEELRLLGVTTSYSTVKKYIADFKKREDICIRFHTKAGEEGQVDFGYVGLTPDNSSKRKKTWVFNLRLSYSRLDYYEKVFDQKVETFIQCHVNAFNFFGGVPEYVKIDNLKAAILEANFYEPVYQTLYQQFAKYYGFNPLPCRVRKPQEKGKVESGIKYVQNNFFLGRKFVDGKDVDDKLRHWLINTCNARIHGTTRKVPQELFEKEEKNNLIKLPEKEFSMPKVGRRLVYHDCHVYIDYNYYSVPFEYVGKEVEIEITNKLVKILYQNRQIAIHTKSEDKGQFVTNESHYPKFKCYLSTAYQEEYQVKMNQIGNETGQLFLLLVSKHPRDWNRAAQGILSLTKTFTNDIVNSACKRALMFNIVQYQVIKNICQNGSYNMPLESNLEVVQ
jgi:transposase